MPKKIESINIHALFLLVMTAVIRMGNTISRANLPPLKVCRYLLLIMK